MGHEIGEIRKDAAGELDYVVVDGNSARLEIDDDARLESPIEHEEVVAGVTLYFPVVAARTGKQGVVAISTDKVVVACTGAQIVVALAADDRVVAAVAEDDVIAILPVEVIIAIRAK